MMDIGQQHFARGEKRNYGQVACVGGRNRRYRRDRRDRRERREEREWVSTRVLFEDEFCTRVWATDDIQVHQEFNCIKTGDIEPETPPYYSSQSFFPPSSFYLLHRYRNRIH
jgi:hypothetical protein